MDSLFRRRWGWSLVGIGLSFAIIILTSIFVPDEVRLTSLFQLSLLAASVIVPLPFILYGWAKYTDEAVNQSHKDASIAGGSIGGIVALVSLLALVTLSENGNMVLPFGMDGRDLFMMLMGTVFSLAATTVFYLLFLVAWWHGKR